ncbi:hypothetical protein HPB51_016301 [Rhipicephalus microplus]|uniref:Uncharacterized protein n=1 Tax=Rhipicephalus microplus TaxID=6941 RepID=A0A9J6CTH7_RHIMP|nr:hypothetical protein HPB51_029799 [Rhipicephalus microplus]KAH8019055.1 hypothetical protein HPB51_016301 [Rhipicephalus microplus]
MSTVPAKSRSPARRQEARMAGTRRARKPPESAAPAPPCAKRQVRSVATWTWQEHQDAPRCFVSDLPWKAQRRVRRETVLDKVPLPFRGHTITERDVLARGARLPDPPGVRVCSLCGVNVYANSHFRGSLHAGRAQAARASGCSKSTPASSMPPTALPDEDLAALCRERMRKKPGFAALVGPGIPSADASAPDGNGNGATSADFLDSFDEDFI